MVFSDSLTFPQGSPTNPTGFPVTFSPWTGTPSFKKPILVRLQHLQTFNLRTYEISCTKYIIFWKMSRALKKLLSLFFGWGTVSTHYLFINTSLVAWRWQFPPTKRLIKSRKLSSYPSLFGLGKAKKVCGLSSVNCSVI